TIDTDADRDARVTGCLGNLLDTAVKFPDVARVDTHRSTTGLNGREDVLRLEVNIRNHRDRGLLGDDRQRFSVDGHRAGHAHNVTTTGDQLGDLLQGGIDVM